MQGLAQKCTICKGLGIVFNPSGGKKGVQYLELCNCIAQYCDTCPGDKKPPYYYFDEEKNELRPCPCRYARARLEKTKKIFERSNIPPKFRFRRLEEFSTESDDPVEKGNLSIALDNARHTIAQFADLNKKEKRGLYLYGPPGTGKTFLACLILNEIALQYLIPVRYVKITRDFFNRIRSSFVNVSLEYGRSEEIFQELANVEVLLIDDFGVHQDSPWEQRTLYDLIDVRYENEKTTLITSNLSLEDIKAEQSKTYSPLNLPESISINQRILSRFHEMMDFVKLITRDYREKLRR